VAHDHGRHDWRSVGPAFRHGFDRGWRDGTEEGLRDGRRRRDPRYWRERDYRNADAGYKRWMGRRSRYEAGYREGYAAAYQRAYKTARPGRPHPARRRDR
jgi:flagellar biosynthesis/type III secretory pathway protein FliH